MKVAVLTLKKGRDEELDEGFSSDSSRADILWLVFFAEGWRVAKIEARAGAKPPDEA